MITLPRPPSTNSLYKNLRKGRAKTVAYQTWIVAGQIAIYQQKPPMFRERVAVTIRVEKRGKVKEDIDNRIKSVLDLLVTCHVIGDDRLVWRVTAEWADIKECEVEVTSYG